MQVNTMFVLTYSQQRPLQRCQWPRQTLQPQSALGWLPPRAPGEC